jgi:hypothetical protein
MAIGNNGGTWAQHYTGEQKAMWRSLASDVIHEATTAGISTLPMEMITQIEKLKDLLQRATTGQSPEVVRKELEAAGKVVKTMNRIAETARLANKAALFYSSL